MTNAADPEAPTLAELMILRQVFSEDSAPEGLNQLALGLSMVFNARVECIPSGTADNADNVIAGSFVEWTEIGGESVMIRFLRENPLSVIHREHVRLIIQLASKWFDSLEEKERLKQEIDRSTHIDALTGLANGRYFKEMLTRSVARSERSNQMLAVMHIDLIGFKRINEQLGEEIGDELLFALSEQLKRLVRTDDFVARLGPDEFAVLLNNVGSQENVSRIIERFENCLAPPPIPTTLWTGARIGIASFPLDGKDAETIMRAALVALKSTKNSEYSVHAYFNELPLDAQ
jgi:diguanylate cyclase (GGDEF)-like protein